MKPLPKLLFRWLGRVARPYLQSQGLLQASMVYNRSALVWQPGAERVVVLAPHMDDETLGCGGTLAQHVQRGASVTAVFLTDGRLGSSALKTLQGEARRQKERELVAMRKQEAHRALEILGIRAMICMDVEDGRLADSETAAAQLREIFVRLQPQIVYLPFFLEEHADHRAANAVLAAALQGGDLGFQCLGYEVWTPLFPNCLVRIDDTVEIKRQAIRQYESQIADADYLHACLGLNAYRSAALLKARAGYAEAFYAAPVARYLRLYAAYCAGVQAPGPQPSVEVTAGALR